MNEQLKPHWIGMLERTGAGVDCLGGDRNPEQKELRTPLAQRLAPATSVPRFASGFPVKARSLEATMRNTEMFLNSYFTPAHTHARCGICPSNA